MPNAQQLRSRLSKKLKELFQLDQPDLDFGFYRIMHAKAEQVQEFIEKDLLKIVEDAFGQADDVRKEELKAKIERETQAAREYGVPDPENSPKVKDAQAEYNAVKDSAGSEADVYDHLYRFFERYYDAGDFISRRYYTRETPGKAAPFAVPYNGEEVKLHWANADQYYIKTAEYFANFTFGLRQTQEFRALREQDQISIIAGQEDTSPLKVHFRIADAAEGEHGNVKATDANKRFFIIHNHNPVEVSDDGELVVNFEYRPDPEKSGQENTWREKRNTQAVEAILGQLEAMIQEKDAHREALAEYLRLLTIPAPTEKDKKRPVLAKYINKYTARNTMDYFIHKDLGGFLRRELDFYIKNEVMRLDDIEDADAPAVESYLAKIRVLRKIASKLIDFLAQLEDFQKKLWLKKKFVVETNYCITLDRVPEELYPDIAANESQWKEWIRLFAIDKITAAVYGGVNYSEPLTVEFLKANPHLVVDTAHFEGGFRDKLLSEFDDMEKNCDGLLICSENFQALNLMSSRYRDQIQCTYIDPPYNTGDSEILYKNEYISASWLSLMQNRLEVAKQLFADDPTLFIAIDDFEMVDLCELIDTHFSSLRREMIIVNHHPQGGKATTLANTHEYMLACVSRSSDRTLSGRRSQDGIEHRPFKRSGTAESNFRYGRPNSFYAILVNSKNKEVVGLERPPKREGEYPTDKNEEGLLRIYPMGRDGSERVWRRAYESCLALVSGKKFHCSDNMTIYQLIEAKDRTPALFSNWVDPRYNAGTHGANLLREMFGEQTPFSYPKSVYTVEDAIFSSGTEDESICLDFFAGSGTTGHAVINLNREGNGKRKYVLVEMGEHFDSALKPRIKKVIYSKDWKNGKPLSREGISHCFKYIRLESYEDTLNNLRIDENLSRNKAIAANATLKEDYMLRYLLDVETKGSQSLLNIDAFADPTAYTLDVKKPGSDEVVTRNIDLIETFNFLIGLRVMHIAMPQSFNADCKRTRDPDLPEDQHTKLVVNGRLKQDVKGSWWFRKIEGWVPMDAANPNNGQREKVLIVWRKLTGDLEKDNLMLDEWFQKNRISTRDFEFDTIYVNGSNNLPNLKLDDENWKVRLIEEDFMKRMWDVEGI